jgi:hypothetical protein
MGEGQGFLADMPPADILSVVKRATFFKQIYAIFEAKNKEQIVTLLKKIGISIRSEQLTNIKIDFNPYTQIFLKYDTNPLLSPLSALLNREDSLTVAVPLFCSGNNFEVQD